MAVLAIGVGAFDLDLAVAVGLAGFGVVLVGVVPEVNRRILFVLTIHRRRGPGVLDRQDQH